MLSILEFSNLRSLSHFIQLYSEPGSLDNIEQSELVSFVVSLSDLIDLRQESLVSHCPEGQLLLYPVIFHITFFL